MPLDTEMPCLKTVETEVEGQRLPAGGQEACKFTLGEERPSTTDPSTSSSECSKRQGGGDRFDTDRARARVRTSAHVQCRKRIRV